MSNPVTNSQVEDVLSSIRRLVSDNRKNGRPGGAAPAQDKLLLTPQLRVSEDGPKSTAPASTDDGPLQLSPDIAVDPAENFDEPEEAVPETRVPDTNEPETSLAESNEPENSPSESRAGGHVSPDGGFVFARRHLALREESDTPDDLNDRSTPEAGEDEAISAARTLELSAKIAALETAIARTADQWEPDGEGRDAYAGTPDPSMTWQEGTSLDGKGEPLSEDDPIEPVATAQADPNDTWSDEEQVIDEAALRALVADIVRSELQGDLGERITRNVRRLVHREIMRALAARELD